MIQVESLEAYMSSQQLNEGQLVSKENTISLNPRQNTQFANDCGICEQT